MSILFYNQNQDIMKKNAFSIGILFLFFFQIHAQNTQTNIINFDSDVHVLDASDLATLDKLSKLWLNQSDVEIQIIGHTDQDGSNAYNQALAQKRAEAVSHYLQDVGIRKDQIKIDWKGESDLIASDNSVISKQKNRRVEIAATTYNFNTTDDIIAATHNVELQSFKIDYDGARSVTGAQGTVLNIPFGVFQYADGTPVPSGEEIIIELKEAITYEDFLAAGLFTHSKGEILETGGMMYINASAGGKALQLKPGEDIEVVYPLQESKDGMELFYANDKADGTMDWTPTGQPFGTIKPNLGLEITETDLNKILEYEIEVGEKPEITFTDLRKRPRVDEMPYPPAEPKRGFPSDYKKYEEKYANYEIALEKYHKLKPLQDADLAKWNKEVDNRFQKIYKHKEDLRIFMADAQAKGELLKLRKYYDKVGEKGFLKALESALRKPFKYSIDDRKLNLAAFGNQSYDILRTKGKFRSCENEITLKVFDVSNEELKHLMQDAIANAAFTEYESSGKIDNRNLDRYITRVNQLGWINCDRFPDFGFSSDLILTESDQSTKYFMIFNNIKSMIAPTRMDGAFVFKKVPVGQEVKILGVKLVDNKPHISIVDHKIGHNNTLKPEFKPGTLAQIRTELQRLETS